MNVAVGSDEPVVQPENFDMDKRVFWDTYWLPTMCSDCTAMTVQLLAADRPHGRGLLWGRYLSAAPVPHDDVVTAFGISTHDRTPLGVWHGHDHLPKRLRGRMQGDQIYGWGVPGKDDQTFGTHADTYPGPAMWMP